MDPNYPNGGLRAPRYQRSLSFGEALKLDLFENYCNFSGRASRSEYWWFALFQAIINAILSFVINDGGTAMVISVIVGLALLLPGLGVAVRRLHDIGKSGWYLLISLIPLIGFCVLIYWYIKPSDKNDNQYGSVPNLV